MQEEENEEEEEEDESIEMKITIEDKFIWQSVREHNGEIRDRTSWIPTCHRLDNEWINIDEPSPP